MRELVITGGALLRSSDTTIPPRASRGAPHGPRDRAECRANDTDLVRSDGRQSAVAKRDLRELLSPSLRSIAIAYSARWPWSAQCREGFSGQTFWECPSACASSS